MKTFGTLLLALAVGPLAFAQDCPPCEECPGSLQVNQDQDQDDGKKQDDGAEVDEDEKSFQEVEKLLNEVLLVDEQGVFTLRKEFRDSLPIPAERVEGMLGTFVFLDDTGKIKIKDREAIRPYLPMIKGFLGSGMERLKKLQELPPEERRKAMREMMERAQRGELEPAPEEEEQVEKPPVKEEPQGRGPAREDWTRREDPPRTRRERFRAPSRDDGDTVEERLTRIERALERIERGMRDGQRPRTQRRREGAERRGNLLERLFSRRDRDRFQRRERRGLGDLFRRDRDRDRGGLRGMFRRGRTWTRGLRKLFEIMEPEDFSGIGEGLRALLEGGLDPESLTDPGKAMDKLRKSLPEEEAERFMEIFSEFVGSEEGRDFAENVERGVERLEKFVNSEEGRSINERVRELQKQFGAGSTELQDRIEELIQGRTRDRADRTPHNEAEKRSSRRNHDRKPERRTAPPSGKLY